MDLKGKEKVRGGYPVPEVGGGLYLSARDGSEHKVTGWGLIESGSQMGKQSRPASFIFSCFGVALQSGDAVPSLNGVGGHLPPESIYLVSRRLSAFVSQSTWVQQLGRNPPRLLMSMDQSSCAGIFLFRRVADGTCN